ncbi:hypothetical protein ACIOEX_25135 [Streptomyces sp. NPDC087850]|uniref:hypothetical protein n=1 Tax=Streptomyces sp. NPDC087850 TaxID=3365809 RepID=UPI0038127EC2
MSVARIPVEQLGSYAANNTVYFPFNDIPRDFEETGPSALHWEFWESFLCSECGKPSDGQNICQNEGCNNYGDEANEDADPGPMTSIYWEIRLPSHLDEDDVARAIRDLPLCLVKVGRDHDEYGLALTGGGMKLTWEIVEAFTRIGSLPPTDKIDLPYIRDRGESELDRYLIAACQQAGREALSAIQSDLKSLERRFPQQ